MSVSQNSVERLPREQAVDLLDRHGISPTEQRIEIASLLFARHQHLSAEQILAQLSRQASRVSKATVYNTLKLFAENGLVREVIIDPAKRFYDSNLDPHHHLFYTDTGRLEDVPPAQVDVAGLPTLANGLEIVGVDVVIRVAPRKPS
ncbi:Iron-responsive regulator Irr [Thioalkalivibrio nitratireducens DSM 14787]|uniref:Ferric uptake regulation protein n=1 Tax=Thioalkalivibrio nitratireducens (strain DSM 14787 / UNIQEM 213 / ALEN2) TaxID=1255043 RepID=L0E0C8_THIND|nr:Fur family transcriptional regulator [Thioalkalivibrio nitratireducens]AGA35289.1 Iron-responsive regulator Irr [Thioalkalivibrio nitratireducens DSM 14787]